MEVNDIIFASLLHDVGKLVMRAEGFSKNHSITGVEFLNRFNNELLNSDNILTSIKNHHAKNLAQANLNNKHIAYLVYEADNISSAIDRRKDLESEIEEEKSKWEKFQKDICLSSVFNKIGAKTDCSYLLRAMEDKSPNNPLNNKDGSNEIKATQNKYIDLKNWLENNITNIKNTNSLLELLEATMSFVPSSTNKDEVVDISLYDHSKLTAAIASCMYKYFEENNISDYKEQCFNQDTIENHRQEHYYRLATFDLSGIQNFIYTISSEKALKSLRARSFYLEFIMEHIQDELLETLELSRANILYSGGGHCYLLLPNTTKTIEALEKTQTKVNDWFIKHFSTDLYLAYASVECSSNDLKSTKRIFKENSKLLSKAKLTRYNITQLEKLFDVDSNKKELEFIERECKICRTSSKNINNDNECELCESLIELGEYLVKRNENKKYGIIVSETKAQYSIELPSITDRNKYFKIIDDKTLPKNDEKVYSINNYSQSDYDYSTKIWIGDYCYKEDNQNFDFEKFANCSTGINRLGVLRADVDNLGTTFTSGFGENYSTISRYATLSRMLNMFYKRYINDLCKDKKLAIVYSGGDDVFIVGAWNDVLLFAKELKEKFYEYTCGKLTLSAGVGFFSHNYPIYKMAELTGDLEDFAKKNNNNTKNSIALFGENKTINNMKVKTEPFVFTWAEFDEILNLQKFIEDKCYFNESEKDKEKLFFSTALIYRIMSLINSKEEISLARFAYTIARLEPKDKNNEILNHKYVELKNKLYELYQNANNKKKLLTVLNLIVYKNRV